MARFVLEALVLAADDDGVVETSVRALAAELSLNKDTVARALRRLRAEALVVADAQGSDHGRFGAGRYRPAPLEGLQRPGPEPAPTPSRRPSSVPPAVPPDQLRLLDDGPPSPPDHSRSSRPTPPRRNDALAPGVRGRPAGVPRDQGRRPC